MVKEAMDRLDGAEQRGCRASSWRQQLDARAGGGETRRAKATEEESEELEAALQEAKRPLGSVLTAGSRMNRSIFFFNKVIDPHQNQEPLFIHIGVGAPRFIKLGSTVQPLPCKFRAWDPDFQIWNCLGTHVSPHLLAARVLSGTGDPSSFTETVDFYTDRPPTHTRTRARTHPPTCKPAHLPTCPHTCTCTETQLYTWHRDVHRCPEAYICKLM